MLELGRIATFNVTKGWIRIDDSFVTKVLERHQVLGLVKPIEPAAAKSQRAKILVYDIQQLLGFGQSVMRSY